VSFLQIVLAEAELFRLEVHAVVFFDQFGDRDVATLVDLAHDLSHAVQHLEITHQSMFEGQLGPQLLPLLPEIRLGGLYYRNCRHFFLQKSFTGVIIANYE